MARRRFIDVSLWQGTRGDDGRLYDGIDWQRARDEGGYEGVIVSTGDGLGTNPLFMEQLENAGAAGYERHLYHFLRFRIAPRAQADIMIARWQTVQAAGIAPRRYWLDVEDTDTWPSSGDPVAWLHELIGYLDEGGIPLGVYTGGWYWEPHLRSSTEFSYLPLWNAAYVPEESVRLYGGWTAMTIWQWGSSGGIPGYDADIDKNISFEEPQEEDDMSVENVRNLENMLIAMFVNPVSDSFDSPTDANPNPAPRPGKREECVALALYRMTETVQPLIDVARSAHVLAAANEAAIVKLGDKLVEYMMRLEKHEGAPHVQPSEAEVRRIVRDVLAGARLALPV